MFTPKPGMDRLGYELSVLRDHLVRLRSVETDIALDLPHSIPLPDGEEIHYGSSTLLRIRDFDQESEIYQNCILPPPNRTIFDRESPHPFRSSSAGLLPSDWSSNNSSVVGCQSVSGPSSKRPPNLLRRTLRWLSAKCCHRPNREDSSSSRGSTKPTSMSVVVPSYECRRLSAFSGTAGHNLASIPTFHSVTSATSDTQQVSRSFGEGVSGCHSRGNSCENRTDGNKRKHRFDSSTARGFFHHLRHVRNY